jgi:hypothetical protein
MEHEILRSYGFSIHGASGGAEKFLSELVDALELESQGLAPTAHLISKRRTVTKDVDL